MMWIAIAACAIAAFTRDATSAEPKPDNPPVTVKLGTAEYASEPGCLGSVKAITYYRRSYSASRARRGLACAVPRVWYQSCPVVKRRAVEWRSKAGQARQAYVAWHERQYDWRSWLPRGWYNVGSCETGYGGPLNWRHRNSSYEGAFGFAVSTWDGYKAEAEATYGDGPYPASAADATPRQQYNVALVVHSHFGLSGWGCRGAYYR